MTRITKAFRRAAAASTTAALALALALTAGVGISAAQQDNASAERNATSDLDAERQDVYLGTASESIYMGQDPVTGDRIIIVTPPAREQQDNSLGNDTEININVTP